jgi:adenylate kinase
VPDDVVVRIVAQRIEEPDARKGFILDGFPRTVPQARALDRMLADREIALDAAVEIRVNEDALLKRIESRIAETLARGETLRDDDDPQVLHRRLAAYREQTAPLIAYYQLQGVLRTVNGMAPIAKVTEAIDRELTAALASKPAPAFQKRSSNPAKKPARSAAAKAAKKRSKKPVAEAAEKSRKAAYLGKKSMIKVSPVKRKAKGRKTRPRTSR